MLGVLVSSFYPEAFEESDRFALQDKAKCIVHRGIERQKNTQTSHPCLPYYLIRIICTKRAIPGVALFSRISQPSRAIPPAPNASPRSSWSPRAVLVATRSPSPSHAWARRWTTRRGAAVGWGGWTRGVMLYIYRVVCLSFFFFLGANFSVFLGSNLSWVVCIRFCNLEHVVGLRMTSTL